MMLVLDNCKVLDVEAGSVSKRPHRIIIKDGMIEAIEPAGTVARVDGCDCIDCRLVEYTHVC